MQCVLYFVAVKYLTVHTHTAMSSRRHRVYNIWKEKDHFKRFYMHFIDFALRLWQAFIVSKGRNLYIVKLTFFYIYSVTQLLICMLVSMGVKIWSVSVEDEHTLRTGC